MIELDAIIAEGITLMAIQSAKSAENAILAADAPQSPRGQTMTDTAPDTIYLQWYDEDGEHDRGIEATWCQDRINANDLEYRLVKTQTQPATVFEVSAVTDDGAE
jgi:hypothetical protein